jgi:hypothetical protein
VRNPGIKPEDKEWLWGETPSASPQVPGTVLYCSELVSKTEEGEDVKVLETQGCQFTLKKF